ncbi:hypothetical protein [Streptomyces sp. NPDC008150]|uniref:hypothetical protein n=1 Tax=Streptomyces sp. NPDC008150 TaxID=3364816 RepID=UPI0036E43EBF
MSERLPRATGPAGPPPVRPRALSFALRVYPASYRRAHGAELASVYADATEGAGTAERYREAASVAAHALRLRTRLTGDRSAVGLSAVAAPLALAVAAGQGVAQVVRLPGSAPGSTFPWLHVVGGLPRTYAWLTALLWTASLVCALAGRWRVARILAVASAAVFVGVRIDYVSTAFAEFDALLVLQNLLWFGLPQLLWAAVTVAAPNDLVDRSWRTRATVAAAAVLTYLAAGVSWQPGWRHAVLVVAVAAGTGLAAYAGLRRLAFAVPLAALPVLLSTYGPDLFDRLSETAVGQQGATLVFTVPLAAVVVAMTLLNTRRTQGR